MLFKETILEQIKRKNSHICVGLDPYYELIPSTVKKESNILKNIFNFLKEIVDYTHDIAVAYKPNLTCFSYYGPDGWKLLKQIVNYIKKKDYSIKIIAECKRTEIFHIGEIAAKELFEYYGFDAYNIMPWYGKDSIQPFIKYAKKDKAVFVICHDSNPSAKELQDVILSNKKPLYLYLAEKIITEWNKSKNIFIETALTYPKQLKKIVNLDDGNQFFLLVGLGAQGGNIKDLKVFKDKKNFIVSASRSILYAYKNNKTSDKNFPLESRKQVKQYIKEISEVF